MRRDLWRIVDGNPMISHALYSRLTVIVDPVLGEKPFVVDI